MLATKNEDASSGEGQLWNIWSTSLLKWIARDLCSVRTMDSPACEPLETFDKKRQKSNSCSSPMVSWPVAPMSFLTHSASVSADTCLRQHTMKHSTYLYVKRLAGLGKYRLLTSQRDGDLCQVECCLPQQKQHISRARQKRARFWPTAVFCTIIIMYVLSIYTHCSENIPTAANGWDRAPFS